MDTTHIFYKNKLAKQSKLHVNAFMDTNIFYKKKLERKINK